MDQRSGHLAWWPLLTLSVEVIGRGPWDERCYLILRDGDALVIDPGCSGEMVVAAATAYDVAVRGIVATHGHFDHILGAAEACRRLGLPLHVSAADSHIIRQANLHSFVTGWKRPVEAPTHIVDLDALGADAIISGFALRIHTTPGHTPGSRCFEIGDALFSGDTILARGLVDSGLPGADKAALLASVQFLTATVPRTSIVYPGHGDSCAFGDAVDRVTTEPPRG